MKSKQLQNKKFRFVLIDKHTKRPFEMNWTTENNYTYDDPKLIRHVGAGNNYGVMGGHGGLIIIDCDNKKFEKEIKQILPSTYTIESGGKDKGKHFYLFSKNTEKIVLEKDGEHLGEVQGEGAQCVGPGSIHPKTKKKYKVINDVPIAKISDKILNKIKEKYVTKKVKVEWSKYESTTLGSQIDITELIDISNFKKSGDEYYGSHPIHGSEGGMNFFVNPKKGLWYCFRHNSGGDALAYLAIKEGVCSCDDFSKGQKLRGKAFNDVLKIGEEKYKINRYDTKDLNKYVLQLLYDKKKDKATEVITQKILNENYIHTTRKDEKSEMWIYRDGIYKPNAKSYIQEVCRDILGISYKTSLSNIVIAKIEAETFIEQEELFVNENLNKVAVENGILDIKKRELEEFNPKYRFFNKLPVTFNKSKRINAIKEFFKEVLKSDEEIKVMQEIFGYLLLRDYKMEKCFMFLGGGRNGKGKTLSLMKSFVGSENCSNLSLQTLEKDNFAIGELFSKMANLAGDISDTALKETGNLKELTGRDMISAARKFLNRISFQNYAKLIFAANNLPKTYDETLAFFNRWVLIDFIYTFLPQKEIDTLSETEKKRTKLRDEDIIVKITSKDELSGLLNWALDGLDRLLKQRDFSYSSSTKDVKNMWLRKSDSVRAFIMDCVDEAWGEHLSKEDFRKAYGEYCKKHKLKVQIDRSIKNTLERALGVTEQQVGIDGTTNRQRCWVGIKLRKDKLEELGLAHLLGDKKDDSIPPGAYKVEMNNSQTRLAK
jgi:P4 family phage/plasmid primase-like protien